MEVYKCIFTKNEVFSTGYKCFPAELVEDLYYVVTGQFIEVDNSVDDSKIGANKSAEDTTVSAADDETVLLPNIISQLGLVEITDIVTKKIYKDVMKKYLQNMHKHVKEVQGDTKRAAELAEKYTNVVKKSFLPKFDKFKFFATDGDEFEKDGAIIHYEQDDEWGKEVKGHFCRIIVFKDGLECEKC